VAIICKWWFMEDSRCPCWEGGGKLAFGCYDSVCYVVEFGMLLAFVLLCKTWTDGFLICYGLYDAWLLLCGVPGFFLLVMCCIILFWLICHAVEPQSYGMWPYLTPCHLPNSQWIRTTTETGLF
jgi:hypothetical protein